MTDAALVEVTYPRPHVAQITLNRPERMNAMSFDLVVPFRDAIDTVAADAGSALEPTSKTRASHRGSTGSDCRASPSRPWSTCRIWCLPCDRCPNP
jgi:enoyl-CoA hydratase